MREISPFYSDVNRLINPKWCKSNYGETDLVNSGTCIFCKIVAKKAPASILYEDETVLAFLYIRPLNMGHTLVIPKVHSVDIFDFPTKDLLAVYAVSKKLSFAVNKSTGADGIRSSSRTAKLQDKTSSICMYMWFPGFLDRRYRVLANLKKLNGQI